MDPVYTFEAYVMLYVWYLLIVALLKVYRLLFQSLFHEAYVTIYIWYLLRIVVLLKVYRPLLQSHFLKLI